MIELGLTGCSFTPTDEEVDDCVSQEETPLGLRGSLEELIAAYDNTEGDISFGIRRFVPDGREPQTTKWFPRIFRNVRRVMDGDTRCYMAMRTPQGRCARFAFLGSIPKYAPLQQEDNGCLLTGSARGRFDFTLRRMARFEILLSKASSVCQAIAIHQLDQSPTQFGQEIFYPLMAVRHKELRGEKDHINRHAYIHDPLRLIEQTQRQGLWFLSHRFTERRRDFQNFFPKRVWVANDQKRFLRFLSYHSAEYPFDDVPTDQQREKEEREIVLGATLTNIASPKPLEIKDEPVDEPVDEPIDEPVDGPVDEPVDEPAGFPVDVEMSSFPSSPATSPTPPILDIDFEPRTVEVQSRSVQVRDNVSMTLRGWSVRDPIVCE